MLLGHRSFVVLDGSVSGFTSSDSDHLFDRHHENLSITDFVGPGGFHNRFNRHVDQRVVDHALNLHLGQKVHHVFRTAIKLGMSFLTAKTFDLGHGHPLNTDFCECLSHFVKFEGLIIATTCFIFSPEIFSEILLLKSVFIGDREPPIPSESDFCHLGADRRLTALIFRTADHS